VNAAATTDADRGHRGAKAARDPRDVGMIGRADRGERETVRRATNADRAVMIDVIFAAANAVNPRRRCRRLRF
jgi:hypothetical protein